MKIRLQRPKLYDLIVDIGNADADADVKKLAKNDDFCGYVGFLNDETDAPVSVTGCPGSDNFQVNPVAI